MTQISWNWACSPQVGDAGPLTVENLMVARMLMGNARPDLAGVIQWTDATPLADLGLTNPSDGLLEPTNPAGDIVRIASGVGMVQGWLYASDGDEDFDVSGGNANATDLIVLRRGDPAVDLSVRLALKRGPIGGAATVTQNALLWEVAIAEVLLDGSGDFSALTDVREFVNTPLLGVVHRQGGNASNWATEGTTNYIEGLAQSRIQTGVRQTDISGTRIVTFPVAFAGTPVVLVTSRTAGAIVSSSGVTSSQFQIDSILDDGSPLGNVNVNWLAIGPR